MDYFTLLGKLRSWIKVIQRSFIALTGVEALIVIIIGVASSNIYHEVFSSFWVGILLFLGLIYILITIIKISYNSTYPSSIVDELHSKREVEKLSQSIDRKDAINNYISRTIIDLSTCKCETPVLLETDDWKEYSTKDIIAGLTNLTRTFNNVLNVLLNTSNINFSTGIYATNIRAKKFNNSADVNQGVFLLRDDFNLNEYKVFKNIMEGGKLVDVDLEIQNILKTSYNNGKFVSKLIQIEDSKPIQIVCINIVSLQEPDYQRGVLFVITKQLENLPDDIESVFKMFANIISHWLDLYNHEVRSNQIECIKTD
jgi:hypothetical protein